MSSLVLREALGIHRIPANTKMKRNLLLQNPNISQLSQDARHGGHHSAGGDTCHLKEHSREQQMLSCPCQAPACPQSAKPLSMWLNPPISAGTVSMLPKCFADLVQEMKHQDFSRSHTWLPVPSTLLSPSTSCIRERSPAAHSVASFLLAYQQCCSPPPP